MDARRTSSTSDRRLALSRHNHGRPDTARSGRSPRRIAGWFPRSSCSTRRTRSGPRSDCKLDQERTPGHTRCCPPRRGCKNPNQPRNEASQADRQRYPALSLTREDTMAVVALLPRTAIGRHAAFDAALQGHVATVEPKAELSTMRVGRTGHTCSGPKVAVQASQWTFVVFVASIRIEKNAAVTRHHRNDSDERSGNQSPYRRRPPWAAGGQHLR